jgi:hypothetical protein
MKQLQTRLAAVLGAALLSISPAMAAPVISTITTTYSATGSPTSIFIIGTALCGSPCAKPTITISGKALTVGNYGGTSVAATLPSGTTDGEYTLVLTTGTTGSFTQPLVLKSTTTVKVGTTTTLAPGSAATVTNTGTATSPVLNFGIPQGVPGLGGITGVTAGTDLSGGGSSGNVTINLNTTATDARYAQLVAANTFTGNQSVTGSLNLTGSLSLPQTTGPTVGVISIGGSPFIHACCLSSNNSTFMGLGAGNFTANPSFVAFNTGIGSNALQSLTSGYVNTAVGGAAMNKNTTGYYNTAVGYGSLLLNTTGSYNTAIGSGAMADNVDGSQNTAIGLSALSIYPGGTGNIAIGPFALQGGNCAAACAAGNYNVAIGRLAGYEFLGGSSNILLGDSAGEFLTGNDSNNIIIGNVGVGGNSGAIRIGTAGTHTRTFIAGISGVQTGLTGSALVIDANGQLGTISSSRRYKEDIEAIGDASDRLFKLRPVTFRYRQPNLDGNKPVQYGLIAEEVAEVFPELVIRNKDGQPETVAYHLLTGLLLNELQKEHGRVEAQEQRISELEANAASQKHQSAELEQLRSEVTELRKLTAQLLSRSNNQLNAVATAHDSDYRVKQ